jgi:hypothetical protein
MSSEFIWVASLVIVGLAASAGVATSMAFATSAIELSIAVSVAVTLISVSVFALLAARIYVWPLAALLLLPGHFRRTRRPLLRRQTGALIAAAIILTAFLDAATSPNMVGWIHHLGQWAMD